LDNVNEEESDDGIVKGKTFLSGFEVRVQEYGGGGGGGCKRKSTAEFDRLGEFCSDTRQEGDRVNCQAKLDIRR
jgi:hypothetical protein